jgi:hypothetical protein
MVVEPYGTFKQYKFPILLQNHSAMSSTMLCLHAIIFCLIFFTVFICLLFEMITIPQININMYSVSTIIVFKIQKDQSNTT